MTNPLLVPPTLPYGAVPFDQIRVEHFMPALDAAIEVAQQKVAAVAADTSTPTFANTFGALEQATTQVYDIATVYSNLRSTNGDAAIQALAKQLMPKLDALESNIKLDPKLFARMQAAHAALDRQRLTPEQLTLVDRTYRSFRRNGALLDEAGKARLRELDQQLSTLGPEFSDNVLKDTNGFELVITSEDDLAGLPKLAKDAAKQAAKERGKPDAWVFTLHAPSFGPFMKYAENRELRRQLYMAMSCRAVAGGNSNQTLVAKIARLRQARARLLGYASHAAFQLEERMAETPERVRSFLDRLHEKSMPVARREIDELRAYMRSESGRDDLMPWDYAFWADKLRERRFALKSEELRPYFPLGRVLQGAFDHARRLYDLEFAAVTNVPVYDPEVQVFEVRRQGEFMGLFYADFFPRPTKRGGAWCSRFKSQWHDGEMHRPHVTIVCNFTKPQGETPALLTLGEATTLFHEFGHALHSLLSRCSHRSLSCTNVYRDFVELPSQIMENWLREKEGLALFAHHYQTGELIPDSYVDKIIASEQFHAAYMTVRQLRFAYLDMAWHGGEPGESVDVVAFERAATDHTDLFDYIPGTNTSCAFEHVFAGGYSAGYYSYKWAEVLDADAFEFFKERGIFDRTVADKFRTAILERGGAEHPMRLYQEFRGREPDPDALLRRAGLMGGTV